MPAPHCSFKSSECDEGLLVKHRVDKLQDLLRCRLCPHRTKLSCVRKVFVFALKLNQSFLSSKPVRRHQERSECNMASAHSNHPPWTANCLGFANWLLVSFSVIIFRMFFFFFQRPRWLRQGCLGGIFGSICLNSVCGSTSMPHCYPQAWPILAPYRTGSPEKDLGRV